MRIHEFLAHHGVSRNPFAEEDAQTDPVFKDHCITSTFHPTWDKVYGDPAEPATSIVFGEKGSGKTALRLQISRHIHQFNREHPQDRLFVVHYDDFNPFLDRFCDRFRGRRRRIERALTHWKLWDHMDAILSLAVTDLVDSILHQATGEADRENSVDPGDIQSLDRHQSRDLLLLAACYDQSTAETFRGRWHRLRRTLGFSTWGSWWQFPLGCLWTVAVLTTILILYFGGAASALNPLWLYLLLALVGWAPWVWKQWKCFRLARGLVRHMRVSNHESTPLRQALMHFTAAELSAQPLPNKDRTDDRYEMLLKLQALLGSLRFAGLIVLVDRLDEPHLINGSAELMKALLWPILDNKFLKHPGLGIKLMVPIELTRFVEREDNDFYQRARLDKQNLVPSFQWTGEALYDVANARLRACANGQPTTLQELFDPAISEQRLIETFRALRVPRRLFKFLYRLLVAHCHAHTDGQPKWQISPELFESTLAVYMRDQEAFDRGLGAG